MSPRVELDDLVNGAEIGRRWEVSRQYVNKLAGTDGFPLPLGRLGNSVIWRWRDVERWAKKHQPHRG